MNGLSASLSEFEAMLSGLKGLHSGADILICPPATMIRSMAQLADGSSMAVGAQACHADASGAHTGDISAEMISDAGATYVIVGHSERRGDHNENDAHVSAQAEAAIRAGLIPIICCGETLAQREAGQTNDVILQQLARSIPEAVSGKPFVVAYEPIWAIGTGLPASPEQIGEVHSAIRTALQARFSKEADRVRLLYGGSMKPGNAADILAVQDVNGGLIGGASLKAEDFLAIYEAAN